MNNLILSSPKLLSQLEEKLPDIVKYQIASKGSPIFTVKTENELLIIDETVEELKANFKHPATASEITEAIKPIFAVLASQRTQQNDIKLEFATWVRLLAGQPLWAINAAVDDVCKTKTFRNLSDLMSSIDTQTNPIVSKIKKLQLIKEKSIQEMNEEKQIKENSISANEMQESIVKAAKDGNSMAGAYLKAKSNREENKHDRNR